MKGFLKEFLWLSGDEWLVSFTTRENPGKLFDKLRGKEVSVDVKEASKLRSLDANAFCWALCSDIGKAITPPIDKEDVYRKAIRAVGVYTPVTVICWDVETIKSRWSSHGVGWFVDVVDDAGIGKKLIHLYYGSSTYSVSEMRLLLDWLIDEAEQMEIPIPISREEEERLLTQWGKALSRKSKPVTSAAG
jgi:hypothetical protein